MFVYEKKLQYPVSIKNPNPALATAIISQFGGPDGRKIWDAVTGWPAFEAHRPRSRKND